MNETVKQQKETPIAFKPEMVQAILEGRKSMTRRLINPQQPDEDGLAYHTILKRWEDTSEKIYLCRYGHTGDLLYVRETFYAYGYWALVDGKWTFNDCTDGDFKYRFFDNKPQIVQTDRNAGIGWYKRPAIFMPKAAARIWLEVTGVKAERVCDISEEDAKAEGVVEKFRGIEGRVELKQVFKELWNKINGPESWEANPWVWVVSFKILNGLLKTYL